MTNLARFKRDLESAVSIRVDRASTILTELAARTAFQQLTTPGVWPIDTYYSIANHKISVGGEGIGPPNPSERPADEGVNLAGKLASNRQVQLNKLKRLKKAATNVVLIGNPVTYAADVGFQVGQGRAIYAEAARFANTMVASAKLSEETLLKSGGTLI